MSRAQQRQGKAGEQIARAALARYDVQMLERIGTPVRIIAQKGEWVRIAYGEKVAGDYRGILRGGRSVLVEVKTTEHNLRWSDFREHQPGALDEHSRFGGLTLVVWVCGMSVYVLEWPIPGFGPGKSITPEQAERLE